MLGQAVSAADLPLPPGARKLTERVSPLADYAVPTGVFSDNKVPVDMLEGRVLRRSWRAGGGATPLQVLAPMRERLKEAGYDIRFQCSAAACGGFDFRFGIEVIPAPDMAVDMTNYHFLSARKGAEEAVTLLVSKGGGAIYLQQIEVAPPADETRVAAESTVDPMLQDGGTGQPLADALLRQGHAALPDLVFETGSVRLSAGPFASLSALTAFLEKFPGYKIALVGHTDAVGRLADNIDLSRRRADAVRQRLIQEHQVDVARVEVAGAGYLAPLASNLTDEGRAANRRVEVVLIGK